MAKRTGGNGAAKWSALDVLPQVGERLLSMSAAVAYVAIGGAALLSRSITEGARAALAWVLPGDGEKEPDESDGPQE